MLIHGQREDRDNDKKKTELICLQEWQGMARHTSILFAPYTN